MLFLFLSVFQILFLYQAFETKTKIRFLFQMPNKKSLTKKAQQKRSLKQKMQSIFCQVSSFFCLKRVSSILKQKMFDKNTLLIFVSIFCKGESFKLFLFLFLFSDVRLLIKKTIFVKRRNTKKL